MIEINKINIDLTRIGSEDRQIGGDYHQFMYKYRHSRIKHQTLNKSFLL